MRSSILKSMQDLTGADGAAAGWSDVFSRGSSGDYTGRCVLDQLELME